MDEARVERRLHQRRRGVRADLDEIAEHVVVLDAQRADGGVAGIGRLQTGDDLAAFVAQLARLVEIGAVAGAHETAVALQVGQVVGERCRNRGDQIGGRGSERRHRLRNLSRNVRRRADVGGERDRRRKSLADRRQIARAATLKRDARQRPRQIGGGGEPVAERPAATGIAREPGHRIEAPRDHRRVGRGAGEAAGEQPGAGAGHRAVDGRDQAAGARAGQRRGQFEVRPRRRIDQHHVAGDFGDRRRQRRALLDLRLLDVGERGGGGRQFHPREAAEAVEALHAEIVLQPAGGGGGIEEGGGERRHRERRAAPQRGEVGVGEDRVGDDHLARLDAGKVGGEPRSLAGGDAELAGRNVDPGDGVDVGAVRPALLAGDGGEVVVARGLEQRVLGERARRHQADHLARHHRLRPALPGLGRVLDLLADGDAVAGGDQLLEVLVGGVDGHAAHGDIGAQMLAALGQRDAQRAACDLGVVEEQLVEIAHPVEQQAIGIGPLDLEILRHHRRRRRGRVGGGVGMCGGGPVHGRHPSRRGAAVTTMWQRLFTPDAACRAHLRARRAVTRLSSPIAADKVRDPNALAPRRGSVRAKETP